MYLLIFYLLLALGISFLCSIMESVLLSVTPSFAAAYEDRSPRMGGRLRKLKTDIDQPLAAILSLNTIAHTVGAAGVGAQAMVVFGSGYVGVTSAVLTFLILILSEIIPKTIGAIYWRQLIPPTVMMARFLIFVLYPLVAMSQLITRGLSPEEKVNAISREEISVLADMGFAEGLFVKKESLILKNLMRFGSIQAKDVMTPRPVMFVLPEDMKVGEVFNQHPDIRVSRIPLQSRENQVIRYYVLKNDLLLALARDQNEKLLPEFGREILVVPEMVNLFRLFEKLLDRREHIALVVDEYGGAAGLVTLEDILETLIGSEILDETDKIANMRKWARNQWYQRARSLGLISEADDAAENKSRKTSGSASSDEGSGDFQKK
ncbi:MAG TPA: CNNM domain-containing protein [Desulfosalsimonadaceae bacterium]|nr:CNNM domain-containing protein [Desulfosalsimonadaceae bacterium]